MMTRLMQVCIQGMRDGFVAQVHGLIEKLRKIVYVDPALVSNEDYAIAGALLRLATAVEDGEVIPTSQRLSLAFKMGAALKAHFEKIERQLSTCGYPVQERMGPTMERLIDEVDLALAEMEFGATKPATHRRPRRNCLPFGMQAISAEAVA